MLSEQQLTCLLYRGVPNDQDYFVIDDRLVDYSIQLMISEVKNNTDKVYSSLDQFHFYDCQEINDIFVTLLSLLLINLDFNNLKNKDKLHYYFKLVNARHLLQIVTTLKNRMFNSALGSRNQKFLKRAMESWDYNRLEKEIVFFNQDVYRLLRLLHPTFKAERGTLLKNIFRINNK